MTWKETQWKEMQKKRPTLEGYEKDLTAFQVVTSRGFIVLAVVAAACLVGAVVGLTSWSWFSWAVAGVVVLFVANVASIAWRKVSKQDMTPTAQQDAFQALNEALTPEVVNDIVSKMGDYIAHCNARPGREADLPVHKNASSYEEVVKAVHRLEVTLPGKRTILSLEPHDLAGVLHSIEQVGDAAGVHERAAALVRTLRDRIKHIASMAHTAPIQPRVFAMEWLDPPYTAGHWVPEMIRLAGGRDEMSREGAPSVQVSWEEIARYDPDILVLMPCSFSLERTINEFGTLQVPAAWQHLKAVQSERVYAVEGATYFSRSGPRTVDGLQILAEIMHPELFPRTSPPNAWTRVATG